MTAAILVGCLSLGCGDHRKNPVGPERLPRFHYANCMKRCTALGFSARARHERR